MEPHPIDSGDRSNHHRLSPRAARRGRSLTRILRKLVAFAVAAVVLGHPVGAAAQTVEYYHLDALGSVRAITDQNAAVVERHDYLPFGEEWNPQPSIDTRKFTGKERDVETGYDYFGARYLSSKTARFTTTDPSYTLTENLVDPQRWNRYVYVRNSPLRYTDPDGRVLETLLDIAFTAVDAKAVYDNPRSAWNWVALGVEVVAVAVPFVPAVGGRIVHAFEAGEHAATEFRQARETVQRAMSKAELAATVDSGFLRGGKVGTVTDPHFVSPAVNASATRARQRLALGNTPEVRATLEVPNGVFSSPSKVASKGNMPGGGMERTAFGQVPARVIKSETMK